MQQQPRLSDATMSPPGSNRALQPPLSYGPGTPPGVAGSGPLMPPMTVPPSGPPMSMGTPPAVPLTGAPMSSPFGIGMPPTAGQLPSIPSAGLRGTAGMLPGSGLVNAGTASWPPVELGEQLTIQILRLLDMPVARTLLGNDKSYKVIAYDSKHHKLGETGPIGGIEGMTVYDGENETLTLTPEEGTLRLKTKASLIMLFVQHVGGMSGITGGYIGKCKIHRQDPRSTQVWPYALSEAHSTSQHTTGKEEPANCGIELKVVEGLADGMASAAAPAMASMGLPGSGPLASPGGAPPDFADPIGLSAFINIDKVTDLRLPADRVNMKRLLLTVNSVDGHKEYVRLMFPIKPMPDSKTMVEADCYRSKVYVQAPVYFGGADGEGAMYVRIGIAYVCDVSHWDDTKNVDRVGLTDPIKITWRPAPKMYTELKDFENHTSGGVHLEHQLMTAQEKSQEQRSRHAFTPSTVPPPQAAPGGHKVSGRTGHFPPGTQEEAWEQAILNCEAQNRATLQRCKKADPHSHEKSPHVQVINGYREWDSLDTLFTTMGPNPLAMSEEVGPSVARGYHESQSVMKDLASELIPPLSQADAHMNLELIKMYYKGDPFKMEQMLRPVICKDPAEIKATKDMSWCPDPPMYAPLRNMSEEDRETLRLACYDPSQNAKLLFQDINPGYRINEDIWGTLADRKMARSLHAPGSKSKKRVKDDCIMA